MDQNCLLYIHDIIVGSWLLRLIPFFFSFQTQMKYHRIRTVCTLIMNKDNIEWKQISEACKLMLLSLDYGYTNIM